MVGVAEVNLFGAILSGSASSQFPARLLYLAKALLAFILETKPVLLQRYPKMGFIKRMYPLENLVPQTREFTTKTAKQAERIGVATAKKQRRADAEPTLSNVIKLDRLIHWNDIRHGNSPRNVETFIQKYGGDS